jgi:hypothetical protein
MGESLDIDDDDVNVIHSENTTDEDDLNCDSDGGEMRDSNGQIMDYNTALLVL